MFGGNGNDNLYAEGNWWLRSSAKPAPTRSSTTPAPTVLSKTTAHSYRGRRRQPGEFRLVRSQSGRSDGSLAGGGRNTATRLLRSRRRLEPIQRSGAGWHGERERVFRSAKLAGTILQKAGHVGITCLPRSSNGNTANAHYQGGAHGNLKSGSSAMVSEQIGRQMVRGYGLPAIGQHGGTTAVAYQQVSGSLFVNGVN